MKTKLYMKVAKSISETSEHHKSHIGAVIVQSHNILSVGVNTLKSHPAQAKYNHHRDVPIEYLKHCLHAEMSAILKAERLSDNLSNATLYIYREDKRGNLAMCRPCPACMAKIKEVGIRKLVYTTDLGIAKEVIA